METAIKIGVGSILAWLVLAAVGVGRVLRGRPGGRANQMEHELPTLRVVRPVLGLVFYLGLLDWLLPGTRAEWAFTEVSPGARWAGVILCAASVALIHRSFTALGRNYHGGVGLWPDHALVTHGPYARVRHPIYTGFVLLAGGIWVSSGSWVAGVSGLALTCAIPAMRVGVEEEQLRDRFTGRYGAYERRTARFLPWLR